MVWLDPNTDEGKQRIREASPLFSVDKIIKTIAHHSKVQMILESNKLEADRSS